MAVKLGITLQNRLRPNDSVGVFPATVEVAAAGKTYSAKANKWGEVSLDITGLPDGTYRMSVTPDNTSAGPVDSTLAEGANPPARIYRSLAFDITVAKNAVTAVSQSAKSDGVVALAAGKLTVGLQPLWMKASSTSRGTSVLSLIVVHHTGGPVIGPAMNTVMDSGIGPHYEIDTEGQVVKYIQESHSAAHAGTSQWNNEAVSGGTRKSVNPISIGIEVVHASGAFPGVQYDALIALLEAILKANPTIKRTRIVGHSDIATNDAGTILSDRRAEDPGPNFEWTRLEAKTLGMVPNAALVVPQDVYSGFFQLFPGEKLRAGADDSKGIFGLKSLKARVKASPKTYDDKAVDALSKGKPVAELQEDLRAIGYTLGSEKG